MKKRISREEFIAELEMEARDSAWMEENHNDIFPCMGACNYGDDCKGWHVSKQVDYVAPVIEHASHDMPAVQIVEKIVEVPVEVEKIVEVEKLVEVPVDRIVHIEKEIEKLVEVIKEVPVEVVVEKLVHIEKEVEKIVEVERIVEVPRDSKLRSIWAKVKTLHKPVVDKVKTIMNGRSK